MPYFVETIPVPKRKKEKIIGYILLIIGLIVVVLNFISDHVIWRRFVSIILAVNAIDSGRKMIIGRKPLFFEWDDSKIQWLIHEKSTSIACVIWEDIRWIKNEKSGGITFFRESSFSEHFDMKWMPVEDQLYVKEQLVQIGEAKKIKLINF